MLERPTVCRAGKYIYIILNIIYHTSYIYNWRIQPAIFDGPFYDMRFKNMGWIVGVPQKLMGTILHAGSIYVLQTCICMTTDLWDFCIHSGSQTWLAGKSPQNKLVDFPSSKNIRFFWIPSLPWFGYPQILALIPYGLPSGKHTKNYGKSQFLMGKLTISMAIFNSKLLVYRRVYPISHPLTIFDD